MSCKFKKHLKNIVLVSTLLLTLVSPKLTFAKKYITQKNGTTLGILSTDDTIFFSKNGTAKAKVVTFDVKYDKTNKKVTSATISLPYEVSADKNNDKDENGNKLFSDGPYRFTLQKAVVNYGSESKTVSKSTKQDNVINMDLGELEGVANGDNIKVTVYLTWKRGSGYKTKSAKTYDYSIEMTIDTADQNQQITTDTTDNTYDNNDQLVYASTTAAKNDISKLLQLDIQKCADNKKHKISVSSIPFTLKDGSNCEIVFLLKNGTKKSNVQLGSTQVNFNKMNADNTSIFVETNKLTQNCTLSTKVYYRFKVNNKTVKTTYNYTLKEKVTTFPEIEYIYYTYNTTSNINELVWGIQIKAKNITGNFKINKNAVVVKSTKSNDEYTIYTISDVGKSQDETTFSSVLTYQGTNGIEYSRNIYGGIKIDKTNETITVSQMHPTYNNIKLKLTTSYNTSTYNAENKNNYIKLALFNNTKEISKKSYSVYVNGIKTTNFSNLKAGDVIKVLFTYNKKKIELEMVVHNFATKSYSQMENDCKLLIIYNDFTKKGNVSFSYPGKCTINSISFQKGTMVNRTDIKYKDSGSKIYFDLDNLADNEVIFFSCTYKTDKNYTFGDGFNIIPKTALK